MYKSSGSLTDKIIENGTGNVHHEMGLFDECLAAVNPLRDREIINSFEAKYCTVFFDSNKKHQEIIINESSTAEAEPIENLSNFMKSSSIAFCIPSSCTAGELRSAVAHRLRHRLNLLYVMSITSEDFCYTKDKIRADSQFGIGAIISSCVIGLIILLNIVATIRETFFISNDNNGILVNCFSLKRNSRAILSTQCNSNDDNLSCHNGITFICMAFAFTVHFSFKYAVNTYNFETTTQVRCGFLKLLLNINNFNCFYICLEISSI